MYKVSKSDGSVNLIMSSTVPKESKRAQISPKHVPNKFQTRKHSSRMRTVHCSGRRGWGGLLARGCLPAWGCLPHCILGYLPVGLPQVHAGIHPPMWTEFLTHACENITFTLPTRGCPQVKQVSRCI